MARLGARAVPRDREIGVVVVAVTPTGHLTVRASGPEFPREGTPMVDVTGRIHGKVSRVFGPVAQPYLTVRLRRAPSLTEAAALVGSSLLREKGNNDGT